MPILIDKDARIKSAVSEFLAWIFAKAQRIESLLPDVSSGIITLKERTLSPTAQLFSEGCKGTREAIAKVRDRAGDVGLWHIP